MVNIGFILKMYWNIKHDEIFQILCVVYNNILCKHNASIFKRDEHTYTCEHILGMHFAKTDLRDL